jgi:erythromycin esterase
MLFHRVSQTALGFTFLFLTIVSGLHGQQAADTAATIALEPGRSVERSIGENEVHRYTVTLSAGMFLYVYVNQFDVNLAVAVHGPDGARLVEVDSAADGPEVVEIEAASSGAYRLEVRRIWEAEEEPYELRVEARTASEQKVALAARRAEAAATRAWIQEHAIPLATVEAGYGFADLQPLGEVIGDARIVGLGEATHGTREFFQLKHRMLEFLVSELGFDVFAIEATLPEAMDVNRYVLTGEGDPARALAGMYFWTWDTEEVLEMIRWMRRYNEDPQHSRKVKFYGVDMQYTPRAARVTLDYLRRVSSTAAAVADSVLDPLADPFLARHVGGWPAARKQSLLAWIRELVADFESRREEYTTRSSVTEWDLVRRHLHILNQAMEMRAGTDGAWARDSAMAANLAWILEREGPRSKAVFWAHNYHVSTQPGTTGWQLRQWFGEGLRVFGFAFDQGEFQSRDFRRDGRLRRFRVEPATAGSLDGQLAGAGLSLAALDLREVPDTGPAARWFRAPRATQNMGAGYTDENPEWYRSHIRVTDLYDALFFVRETSAARANPTGHRPGVRPPAPNAVNLDFEAGEPGGFPVGWTAAGGTAQVEWDVALTREAVRQGMQAVVIRRTDENRYGETAGELSQRIHATRWRGQRVTLGASARIEGGTAASRGYLWMRVTRPAEPWPETVFYEHTAEPLITLGDWGEYEIAADIPDDADVISYGFAFVGPGQAWIDAVSLGPDGGGP